MHLTSGPRLNQINMCKSEVSLSMTHMGQNKARYHFNFIWKYHSLSIKVNRCEVMAMANSQLIKQMANQAAFCPAIPVLLS